MEIDHIDFDILQRLLVALGIGLIVGVERGWRERKEGPGMRTAGVRTFTLIGLLGGIVGALAKALDDPMAAGILLSLSFVAFTAAFAAFRVRELMREKSYGMTTVVAAMATFGLGAYALLGNQIVAAAGGVAVVIVLAVREVLHDRLRRLTWPELRAAIVLAAMTFLALPVIPDESYGPFGGVNPRQIWLLAVILAGVSFIGYAAVKRYGTGHGLLIAAAAGGLVSSTAVNLTSARRAANGEADVKLLAASTTLATGVAFLRSIGLALVLNWAVGLYAAIPLLVGALASFAIAYFFARKNSRGSTKSPMELRNPFSLREALLLAAVLAVVKLVTGAATEYFGSAGALLAAFIAGIADTDSLTYSMSELGRDALTPVVAALGILVANASNSIFKVIFGLALGTRAYAAWLVLVLGLPLAAGAAVVPFLFAL